MKQEKGRVVVIVPTLVIIILFISYFFGWKIGALLHPDSTAYDMAQLAQIVNKQIDEGKESGTFYVSGITEKEIANINDNIVGMNGIVDQYSILENSRGGMRIYLKYEISDNYYVYEKYVNNKSIPNSRPAAIKLYNKVVEVLDSIIEPGMTDYEKELAIHDYIVANCSYGYIDYSKEYAYRAYGVLIQNKAVCNGYAEAMALLLDCVGIENKIMTGWAGGELHAWNRVLLDGNWYQVDATWNDPLPDRGEFVGHMYFNVTDDIMDDMHTWDKEFFEECDSMDYNYFEMKDFICDYEEFKDVVIDSANDSKSIAVEVVLTDYNSAGYDFQFIFDNLGLNTYQMSQEAYGEYNFITIYFK